MGLSKHQKVLFHTFTLILILFELRNINGAEEQPGCDEACRAPVDQEQSTSKYGDEIYTPTIKTTPNYQTYQAKSTPAYGEQAYKDQANSVNNTAAYSNQTYNQSNQNKAITAYGERSQSHDFNIYEYKITRYINRTSIQSKVNRPLRPSTEKMPANYPNKPNNRKVCQPTPTVMNGGKPVKCAGALIFEDYFLFDELDRKKWKLERRFATEPDNEFNMYLDDVDEVFKIRSSLVHMKPKPTSRHFPNLNENLQGNLSLGLNCTGSIDTADCERQAENGTILPPFITAQLSTKGLFSFKYGRVEITARVPQTDWVFPQFWLQPVENVYGAKDYQSGQIRIAFSQMNGRRTEYFGGVLLNVDELRICAKPDWNDTKGLYRFYTFSMTWTEYDLSFAVDGREYCKVYATDKTQLPNRELLEKGSPLAPFDQEFYLTIGYGIGGHNDFDDSNEWRVPKPWVNYSRDAQTDFWNSIKSRIDQWLIESLLMIGAVRVYSI